VTDLSALLCKSFLDHSYSFWVGICIGLYGKSLLQNFFVQKNEEESTKGMRQQMQQGKVVEIPRVHPKQRASTCVRIAHYLVWAIIRFRFPIPNGR